MPDNQCGNPKCWCAKTPDKIEADDIHIDDIDSVIKANHKIIGQLKTLNEKLKKLKADSCG